MNSESGTGPQRRRLDDTLKGLPPEWPDGSLAAIKAAIGKTHEKLVVLDDDPTGTQTVYGVPVLTEWSVETLAQELSNGLPSCYVLTNSRSLAPAEAQSLAATVGRNLREASRMAGRGVEVVSRSDSTLRGHFPAEVDSLAVALRTNFDAWILVPFFLEGGRYTIDDVHYVAEGDWLTPAGQTEFARDPAFGYRSSDLRQWVEEKTAGRVPAKDVASVSIEDLRVGGPDRVTQRLAALGSGAICVVNAASMRDLEVFTEGLLRARSNGKRFLYRTAASFVRARLGLSTRPLLTKTHLDLPDSGGALVVVGSHVPRTTTQLQHLLDHTAVASLELQVSAVLSPGRGSDEVERVAREADALLHGGRDVVVFTSRDLAVGQNAGESLSIGQQVSEALVSVVRAIESRPRYILAKGGITSSDVATEALGVRRAVVLGQVLPGVPLWELGPESRHPGMKLIVFPGNVGGPSALTDVVTGLRAGD